MSRSSPDRPPRDFLTEWREGDPRQRLAAVLKRLAPILIVMVFIWALTTFSR